MYFMDNDSCALKPMNCPEHAMIFKHKRFSYKDLPVKISEFGMCTRKETASALHGLIRVKGFTQDDAHVYCKNEHIEEIIKDFCSKINIVYRKFGFEEIEVHLSTRPDKFAGKIETWDEAETILAQVAKKLNLPFKINPGDGAFYGPKLDFHIKDNRGRTWQCGTIQLDFVLGSRLEASYINENGEHETPVIIHHAVLGSMERFLGIVIEHYKGRFPVWLAPIQVALLTINSEVIEYANYVKTQLMQNGIRVALDQENDTINYKIRKWWTEKMVPIAVIIGKKEAESGSLALRINGQNTDPMTLSDLVESIKRGKFE
jgi:threonyl-tRNA synthetase